MLLLKTKIRNEKLNLTSQDHVLRISVSCHFSLYRTTWIGRNATDTEILSPTDFTRYTVQNFSRSYLDGFIGSKTMSIKTGP